MSQHPGSQHPRKVRRAPNFVAFLFSGALVGLLAGFVVNAYGPAADGYESSSTLGFLGLIFAGLGALVAGIIAVLLDRRS
ncbi:MAG: hypothetical protein ABI934_08830 [Actinomycetota bacterium]